MTSKKNVGALFNHSNLTNEIKNTGNISIDGIFGITEQNGGYITNYNEIYYFFEEKYNDEIATYYSDVIKGFNEAGIMLSFGPHDLILTENKILELEEYLREYILTGFLVDCCDEYFEENILGEFEGKTLMDLHEYCYENVLWKISVLNELLDKCCLFQDFDLGYVYEEVHNGK